MVKLPSAIAACLCMGLALASPWSLAAEGLLKDPGFEGGTRQVGDCTRVRGSLPLNWSDNSCWHTEAQVTYEPVPLPARSGRALKVSLSRGRFQLVQPFELPLDAQLRAGVWMRADPPMVVKVGLRQSGPPYQEHGVRTLRIQDEWTWVEATSATHGLWDRAGRQALFLVTSATPGNLWLDEASLKVAPSTLTLPPMEVPPAYFGTHVHHAVNLKSAQAESGAGAVRIWDSSQSQWFQVQKRRPRPGQKNHEWGALDERVSLASQKGQDLLMVLGGYAPAWASMPEGANEALLPECHRCSENPTRLSDWQNWVADVAGRYKGRSIRAWETWNEPNFPPKHPWCPDEQACRSGLGSFYKGTPEQLLVLQNEAARIVRQVDPGAWVVSPGISHHHRNYLDYFLRIGGGREVDAIGYHFYLEGLPESLMPHALSIRLLMKDHGLGSKPLWNTEGGVPVVSPEFDPAGQAARQRGLPLPSKEELGAAYLARFMVVGWAAGVERFFHYAWDGQPEWGSSPTRLNRNTNATEGVRPAGQAYRQVRAWMSGRKLVRMETGQAQGLWRATWRDAQGRESQIVWFPDRPAGWPSTVQAPAGASRRCDITGACSPVKPGGAVEVDHRPIYIGP